MLGPGPDHGASCRVALRSSSAGWISAPSHLTHPEGLWLARIGPATARASRATLAMSAAGHLKAAPGPLDGVCSTS